jgi:hypothetical protein
LERRTIGLIIIMVGVTGLLAFPLYSGFAWNNSVAQSPRPLSNPETVGQWSGQDQTTPTGSITLDEAKAIAQQYLTSLGNPDLAIKEIMEFQYNFYIIYCEKYTGRGAFEMLIWKQAPPYGYGMMGGGYGMGGGMMGGYAETGAIVPEPGPNMMWNVKYGYMRNGMMGFSNQASGAETVSGDQAAEFAKQYLDANFNNAGLEMSTHFYGYYTFDFTVNGEIAGMLSVNAYTGQVWYHSWHGGFVQEVEFD